jgi:hypothetical protein
MNDKSTKVLEIRWVATAEFQLFPIKKASLYEKDAFSKSLTIYAVSSALFFSWIRALLPLRSR